MYAVHLRLLESTSSRIHISLIELFSLNVLAEALQVNIDWKLLFLKGVSQFGPKLQLEMDICC